MSKLPWADKKLGQHFLNDQSVIMSIVSDHVEQSDYILEIGPGPGILSEFLCKHNKPFQVIEKDGRMVEYLKEHISGDKIMITDALEVDLESYFNNLGWKGNIWLVSNLPYNVSVPLLTKFIQSPSISKMTLMFQKEVGEKVLNWTGKENGMGSLMALTQNYFHVNLKCPVPPGAFTPPPKVDSVVLSLVRNPFPAIGLEEFNKYESFLRKTFANKRKQIGSVWKSHFDKDKIEESLAKLKLDRTIRAERFTLEDVQFLYRELNSVQ
ncbi:MAG: ribosomal RNA small subunit methyltransferase A [Bacteriovoracaceae bacterium]|nr:ribosomal RNA small subunit methyltransferase A [Bacteriovoracaceae bacterium]